MKKIFNWILQKAINFFKWIWRECKDWRTLVLLAFVCIVVGSPVWICGLLGLLFNWAWAWAVFAALLAFWWLPGMPYFAVCVSITLVIKRFFEKYQRKKQINEKNASAQAATEQGAAQEADIATEQSAEPDNDAEPRET